jgi:hypothetical protein
VDTSNNESSNERIVREFRDLLKTAAHDERAVQSYLEANTELLLTPSLLNHGLHFNAVISQFPVNRSLTSDFAYLTKSSVAWRLVLVEIEQPGKTLFTNKRNWTTEATDFKDALAQVRTWQEQLTRDRNVIRTALGPLLQPLTMRENRLDISYVLVIGRDNEIENDQDRRDRIASLGEQGITVLTYDSLLRGVEREPSKNVLAVSGRGFRIKHLHRPPGLLFAFLRPNQLLVETNQRAQLVSWGYDMDAWDNGELLVVNGKRPMKQAVHRLNDLLS